LISITTINEVDINKWRDEQPSVKNTGTTLE